MLARILLLCILFWFSDSYSEKINLESYASEFNEISIAIFPFKATTGKISNTKNLPENIISEDLNFTGRFKVINSKDVAISDKNIGVYIDGKYILSGNEVKLECCLRDASSMQIIDGKAFSGKVGMIRAMVHRFSNAVYKDLLGEKGPFETKLVYVKLNGKNKDIIVADYDGFNAKKITSGGINIFPAFADNSTLLWVSFNRGKPDIYKGSILSGFAKIFLYSRKVETSPDYSTATEKCFYSSSRMGSLDIYSCNIDGSGVSRLTSHYGIETAPAISPNGAELAFTSDKSGQPQIYIMSLSDKKIRRITFNGKYQDSPSWSPKGDKIAYSSYHNGKFDIWIINPDGSGTFKVTEKNGNNEYPSWSADGSNIIFESTVSGKSDLFIVHPDGSGLKRVTNTGMAKMPSFSH